jgi:hypothetical protein
MCVSNECYVCHTVKPTIQLEIGMLCVECIDALIYKLDTQASSTYEEPVDDVEF